MPNTGALLKYGLHPLFYSKTPDRVARLAERIRQTLPPGTGGISMSNSEHRPTLVRSNQPFRVVEVGFYQVCGQRWSHNLQQCILDFPFRTAEEQGDIVPIAGGIYVGKRRLDDREMAKIGLLPVRDEDGKKVSFPFYCTWGTRVIMDAQTRTVPIWAKAIDRGDRHQIINEPHIISNSTELEGYCSIASQLLGGLEIFAQRFDLFVFDKWQKFSEVNKEANVLPISTFHAWFHDQLLIEFISATLTEHNYCSAFPSCSLQFKGAGAHYIGHAVDLSSYVLGRGEAVILTHENFHLPRSLAFVGFPVLLDHFGIFLDQRHQLPPASADPVGGMIEEDTHAIQKDLRLMAQGAAMGQLSLSSIKLLSGEVIRHELGLTEYTGGDLHVLCRAAGGDTRRLVNINSSPGNLNLYLSERYGTDLAGGKIKHLHALAENLGKNVRAVLLLRLSCKVNFEQKYYAATSGNLSPEGMICDSTELVQVEGVEETKYLVYSWLKDLYDTAEIAGLSFAEFVDRPSIIELFLKNIFHKEVEIPEDVLIEAKRHTPEAYLTDITRHIIQTAKTFIS